MLGKSEEVSTRFTSYSLAAEHGQSAFCIGGSGNGYLELPGREARAFIDRRAATLEGATGNAEREEMLAQAGRCKHHSKDASPIPGRAYREQHQTRQLRTQPAEVATRKVSKTAAIAIAQPGSDRTNKASKRHLSRGRRLPAGYVVEAPCIFLGGCVPPSSTLIKTTPSSHPFHAPPARPELTTRDRPYDAHPEWTCRAWYTAALC